MVAPLKKKITLYILIALIIGFFAIPLVTLCLVDCTFNPPKQVASILLFFFR